MPVRSQAQRRLMEGIAHGSIKPKGTLTPSKAQEFISATPKGAKLPERKTRKK